MNESSQQSIERIEIFDRISLNQTVFLIDGKSKNTFLNNMSCIDTFTFNQCVHLLSIPSFFLFSIKSNLSTKCSVVFPQYFIFDLKLETFYGWILRWNWFGTVEIISTSTIKNTRIIEY
jgi:hypothetical protein